MRKLLIIFLSFFIYFFLSSSFQLQENEITLVAKVEKIDCTENSFIVYFKNKTGKGVFSMPKICSYKNNVYKYKLQAGKIYSFKLKKSLSVYMPEHQPKESIHTELVDGKIIWTSKMNRVFYEDCLNICGLYIDNEVKVNK
ncbi:hypothetical protein [Chryseobacterium gregarium]|uniref:hypothetical protein n=1 Tax=Chryseobacterium gregarium TaxID=456299 RepID=UPI00048836BB|nr:hypothetical protein [Chryseobacterium gregarium]